jgi:aminocarboxymuconate-semialdehyde decarboxylase
LASFRRFYFDTALSSSPSALPSLRAFAQSGHILFGTDFPFAPNDVTKLDTYEDLTRDEQRAIRHRSAWTLFPRLASQGPRS